MPIWVRLNGLALFVALTLQISGATLRGIVTTEEGRSISGARVLVFCDLSIFMMQRGMSDRNGNYQFSVEPGKYRVVVLKKGYLPDNATLLVMTDSPKFPAAHSLIPESMVDSNQHVNNLKRLLRRTNREPFRETSPGPESLAREEQPSRFGGSLSSSARQGSSQTRTDSLTLTARLSENIRLHSDLTQSQFESNAAYQHLSTTLEADHQDWSWTVEAERIVPNIAGQRSLTEALQLGASFRAESVDYNGSLSMSEDRFLAEAETATRHELRQNWLGLFMEQGVAYREWRSFSKPQASLLEYSGKTALGEANGWQVALVGQDLRVGASNHHNFEAWLLRNGESDQWRWDSGIGVQQNGKSAYMLAKLQLTHEHESWQIALDWNRERGYAADNSEAVFGKELIPLAPYALEGLSEQSGEDLQILLALTSDSGWRQELRAQLERRESVTIGSFGELAWLPASKLASQGLDYSLSQRQTRTRLDAQYLYQQGVTGSRKHLKLGAARNLLASSSTGMILLFQLSVSHSQWIPGWWLLESEASEKQAKAWYEGQLSLQF